MTILDTSAIIEILKGTEKGGKIKELLSDEILSITPISIHEILILIKEDERESFTNFLNMVKIYNFESNSSIESSKIEINLKNSGNMIQRVDTFIAGICLARGERLITLDKDFEKIGGLNVKVI